MEESARFPEHARNRACIRLPLLKQPSDGNHISCPFARGCSPRRVQLHSTVPRARNRPVNDTIHRSVLAAFSVRPRLIQLRARTVPVDPRKGEDRPQILHEWRPPLSVAHRPCTISVHRVPPSLPDEPLHHAHEPLCTFQYVLPTLLGSKLQLT